MPKLTDLSPLREAGELRSLTLPPNAKDIAFLRDLPSLTRLGFAERSTTDSSPAKSREEFWKEYDQSKWRVALREAGITPKSVKQLDNGTWDVNLENTELSDLGVLAGAPISRLNVGGTTITDLTRLRDLPLTSLNFYGTKVRDLSPLQGMALERLHFSGSLVADLTPLRGMPLKTLGLGNTPVADLSVLRGMQLVEIKMRNTAVTDLSPLADSKTIEVISLPANSQDIEFLRDFPNVQRISFNEDPKTYVPDQTAEDFWAEYDERRVLSAMPGDASKHKKLADGTWELDFGFSTITDLTPLKDLRISSLKLGDTPVADLTPLRHQRLKKLGLNGTQVTDLSPLATQPIADLSLHRTKVADISALRGMPLTVLNLRGTLITDLTPLAESKSLKTLILPAAPKDIEFLRDFRNLKRVGYAQPSEGGPAGQPFAKFWDEHDELRAVRAIPGLGDRLQQRSDGGWELTLDRLPITDLKFLSGTPITHLRCGDTGITDLSPLRGLRLKHLNIYNTKVRDLSPLVGMPLEDLRVNGTPITGIEVVSGLPLTGLRLHNCANLTDLSPLADCKRLTVLTLPPKPGDIEFLRALPLKHLSFKESNQNDPKVFMPDKTAAQFWKEYDAKR